MKMILKYILILLILTNIVNAKVDNCQVGKGKDAFMTCMVEKANETNSIEDMNLIAALYVADKKYEDAIKWYEKSAKQDDAKAAFFLGGIYDEALGVEKEGFSNKVKTYLLGKDKTILANQKEAIKWYKKAAMQNYDDAMPHMNEMMEKVYGKEDTIKLYQQEIREGNDVYWNKQFLANFYFRLHDYQNREQIYKELIKEYPKEKASWLFAIGNAYNKRFLNNVELENKYYKESAELGNSEAMRNLGIYYGDQKDYKTAEMWFRKAGHDSMVCYMYKEILKDKEKALECYEKEAEDDELLAIYTLAYTYSEYDNYEKALNNYQRASALGSANATYAIGTLFEYIFHDKKKAVFWYEKAASMGNIEAIKELSKKGEL